MSNFLEKNQKALDNFNKEANLNLTIKKINYLAFDKESYEAIQLFNDFELRVDVSSDKVYNPRIKYIINGNDVSFSLHGSAQSVKKAVDASGDIKSIAEILSNVNIDFRDCIFMAHISKAIS